MSQICELCQGTKLDPFESMLPCPACQPRTPQIGAPLEEAIAALEIHNVRALKDIESEVAALKASAQQVYDELDEWENSNETLRPKYGDGLKDGFKISKTVLQDAFPHLKENVEEGS